MAANVPVQALSAAKQGALSSFDRVSKIVYLYRPRPRAGDRDTSSSSSSSPSPSPRLILVGGWMDAREPHLAKYTAKLQALFPDSPILLVRSFAYHFTGFRSRMPAEIEPAVPLIRSLLAAGGESTTAVDDAAAAAGARAPRPQMLVHVFSNGGSTMLRFLYEAYAWTARAQGGGGNGNDDEPSLPPHVTVFDSAPGRFSWRASARAFSMGFARRPLVVRLLLGALVQCFCAAYWILLRVRSGLLETTWAAHNDRAANGAEVRRAYVYSEADRLVEYRDVEAHAARARACGYEVRLEKFVGTAHVAHVRGDEERYWNVVKEAWEGWTTR